MRALLLLLLLLWSPTGAAATVSGSAASSSASITRASRRNRGLARAQSRGGRSLGGVQAASQAPTRTHGGGFFAEQDLRTLVLFMK
jgi:hypothetical protein